MPDIEEKLEALAALHPRRIDLSLDPVERLLDQIGRPHDRMAPVLHIAGTNGKGSTQAFLRAILEADGKRVHAYTSPHLVRFNERIRIAEPGGSRIVDDAMLIDAIDVVRDANGGAEITYFEITTAIAFLLFANNPADYCVIEVGLGGRFDATNVFQAPLAGIITPISFDHPEFLGDDLTGIASEKAGILKRGRPGVIGPQDEHVMAMIGVEANATGAPLFSFGEAWTAAREHGRLVYQDDRGLLDLPLPRLIGGHQIVNAAIAVAALRHAAVPVAVSSVETGIATAFWPARLQRLASGPFVEQAPDGAEIWLDGGHNPAAAVALAATMAELEERHPCPLILVCGIMSTKNPQGFFAAFEGLARHALMVPVPGSDAGFTPEQLVDAAMEANLPARAMPDVAAALAEIAGMRNDPPPRILICGSLYLAGAVLRENGPVPD